MSKEKKSVKSIYVVEYREPEWLRFGSDFDSLSEAKEYIKSEREDWGKNTEFRVVEYREVE